MNKKMRRTAFLMLAVLLAAVPYGCSGRTKDADKLTIYVTNRNFDAFFDAMRENFPDIEFEIYQYNGINGTNFMRETLVHGDGSDLIFCTQKVTDDLAEANMIDLSGYGFVSGLDPAMLHQYDVNGRIYQIPGPVQVRCMAYNKTLFERYGWEVPENFDGLVRLVGQIRDDAPGLIPIAMSLGGVGYPFTCVTTFSQAGFLSTPSGAEWEKKYLAGESSVEAGWSEGIDMMARLIDAGAFSGASRFVGKWDDVVINECFSQGEAAMMFVWGGQSALVNAIEDSDYEIKLLPFFGTDEGQKLLGVTAGTNWAVNKRLAAPGNGKKLSNAVRVMEWITTPEAQGLLALNSSEIPSLKKADSEGVNKAFRELWDSSGSAYKAPMVYSGYEDVIVDCGTVIQEHLLSGDASGMGEELIKMADVTHANTLAQSDEVINYGEFTENFTREQSVQLIADVLDSAGLADFAMITVGGRSKGVKNPYGVNGWVYAGKIDNTNSNILFPGGGSKCVDVLTLTGAQIKELMEKGKMIEGTDGTQVYWPYFWSGIDVSLKNGKIISAALDGKAIEDDKSYRVAFMNGDYSSELGETAQVLKTDTLLAELFISYLEKNSPIAPPNVSHPGMQISGGGMQISGGGMY